MAGPTIFLLVFSLCQPLDSPYKVRYEFSDKEVISYDSTCTVKEVLMQCLCSIQNFHEAQSTSYDRLKSEAEVFAKFTPPPTNVLAVATHSDLVDESEITKVDESLKKSILKTKLKEKGMVEFATPDRLIIPIDNFDDKDGPKLRKVFDRVIQREVEGVSPYKVEIPTHWLALELYLRQLESSVVSYNDCLTLGGKLGIGSKELVSCLWFLHHQMGTIRHYKEAKELEGIVITKPNVIFRAVTEFITSTFDLDKVNHTIIDDFRWYGLFKRTQVESIFNENERDLCLNFLQFVSLLYHLKILGPASIPEYDYFLPCALAHAPPAAADGSQLAEYDPLLVAFPGGFVPKGVFSSTLADLCQNDWEIECDDMAKPLLYRDQATMIAYDHSIAMKARPKYLEFTVKYKTNGSFCKIFNTVLTQLDKTLNSVLECLGYSNKFSYGFRCQITQQCKDQNPAHFSEALLDKSKLKCLIKKRICDLEGTRKWWFRNTVQECSSPVQPAVDTPPHKTDLIPKTISAQTERSANSEISNDLPKIVNVDTGPKADDGMDRSQSILNKSKPQQDKPDDDQPKYNDISFTELTAYDEGSAEYTATRDFALQKIILILHTCNDNEFWAALEHLEAPVLRGVAVDRLPQRPVKYMVNYVVGTFAGVSTAVIKTQQGNFGRPALRKALKEDFPHVKLIIGGGIGYSKSSSFGNVLISKQIENFVQAKAVNDKRTNIDGERVSVGPNVMSLFVTNPYQKKWDSTGVFVCSTNNRASKAIVGCIVSAPTLVRSKDLKNELFKHAPGGIGGEMEGWVLMEVANELKGEEGRDIEFIVIKGVADFGDNDKNDDWQFTAAKAAFNYTHYCMKNAGSIPFLSSSDKAASMVSQPLEKTYGTGSVQPSSSSSCKQDALSIEDSNAVMRATQDITEWDILAAVLGIPAATVRRIKSDNPLNAQLQQMKIIDEWLMTGKASWSSLVAALRDPLMRKGAIAAVYGVSPTWRLLSKLLS